MVQHTVVMNWKKKMFMLLSRKPLVTVQTKVMAPLNTFCAIRPHFFYMLDYVTRRSEKLDFPKKKKKDPGVSLAKKDHLMHIYVSMQKWHLIFLQFGKSEKLRYTWIHFVIPISPPPPIADLKKFRLCNVIQQIKKSLA